MANIIETNRLYLRSWRGEDFQPFMLMNKDPQVMEHFLAVLTEEESKAFFERIRAHFNQHGFGLFACVIKETEECIGYVGLAVPSFESHFTPCVEIGWRLRSEYWGKGYATEAARAVLAYGFNVLNFKEIVSFTVPANSRSIRVMEKLGMHTDPQDNFEHPRLPIGHRFSEHVLYRLTQDEYKKGFI